MLSFTLNILKRILLEELILKYRLHITILFAVSLYLISGKNNTPLGLMNILSFSLCHFAFHLYNRALDRDSDLISNPSEALKDYNAVPKLKFSSHIIAICAVLNSVFWGGSPILIIAFALMAFLYNNLMGINIKKVFFIKNLYMAIFYAIPFCLFNTCIFNHQLTLKVYLSFLNYLFTILAIEALWDIKDIEGDRQAGVKTIANKYGITYTKIYAAILMIVAWCFQYLIYETIVYYSTFLILYYLIFLRKNCSVWNYHLPLLLILIPTLINLCINI